MPRQTNTTKEIDEEKLRAIVDGLKKEVEQSNRGVKKLDIIKFEGLTLAILAYKDDKGNVNVLLNIHGQKPSNSLSFPTDYIDDLVEIAEILMKNKDVFRKVLGTRSKTTEVDVFKSK